MNENKHKEKTTKFFSHPLMKQNIKSNYILTIIVVAVMCLICVVTSYATSIMQETQTSEDIAAAQEDFYSYLYIMASYNEQAGTTLSYEDFSKAEDKTMYETAFQMANQLSDDMNLSVEGLEKAAEGLENGKASIDTYVRQFEYVYALGTVKGCFSGDNLDMENMMTTMLATMGVEPEKLETLAEMDTTALFNQMDYTIMGLLPIFLFIVIVGNSLVVNQVDRGSMAYVLSTPTKRSAVTNTQAIFMIVTPLIMIAITCVARLIASFAWYDEVNVPGTIMLYVGMYILTEALAGICYFGSCFFNQSGRAMAFGGGITVWCFIASLLGMFGSPDMVNMGFGVKALDIFNKITLVGLYDVNAISTVGTDAVNYDFVWKLIVLAAIALVSYTAGSVKFQKKDLPL